MPFFSDGEVNSMYDWDLDELVDYTYCTAQGCSPNIVGQTRLMMSHEIAFFPDVTLGGRFEVRKGPDATITQFKCTTYHEIFPADQPKHTWGNCADAVVAGSYTWLRNIFDQSWTHPVADTGMKFHTEIVAAWKIKGDATNSTLRRVRNSHSYTVGSTGRATYPFTP